MKRKRNTWSEAEALDWPIDTNFNELFPAVTLSGAIYFTRTIPKKETFIYKSKLVDNKYEEPKRLGIEMDLTNDQFSAFVSPDESYIIVPNGKRKRGKGGTNYYVCFRNKDDKWSKPFNLNKGVNSEYSKELSVYVSPDGEYLYFVSDKGPNSKRLSRMYRVNGSVIENF